MNVDWARYATVRELLEELENRAKCEIFMNQVAGSLSDVCDYYRRALPDTVLGHRAENPEGLIDELLKEHGEVPSREDICPCCGRPNPKWWVSCDSCGLAPVPVKEV